MEERRYMFAGGGTGGHVFPAIAIADEIRRSNPHARFMFIGTKDRIESRVVPQAGYQFRPIWISGFQRRVRIDTLLFPIKVIVSLMQSFAHIRSFKPNAVIGTGGYVSGPVVFAASILRIPCAIHEQNGYPGITTRLLARRVTEVYLTFDDTRYRLKGVQNMFVVGNPTRRALDEAQRNEALAFFGFEVQQPTTTVLVFGGSLGARTINTAIAEAMAQFLKHGFRVIWQTGTSAYEDLKDRFSHVPHTALWMHAFIDRMDLAYAAGDLVVCRAGATTVAELTRIGKPAILVPYPHATANHQAENARVLEQSGAAVLVPDHEASQRLAAEVIRLANDSRELRRMAASSKSLGKPDAACHIAHRVRRLAGETGL